MGGAGGGASAALRPQSRHRVEERGARVPSPHGGKKDRLQPSFDLDVRVMKSKHCCLSRWFDAHNVYIHAVIRRALG